MALAKRRTTRPRGPMPTVTWDGTTYSLRSRNVEVPDLSAMSRFAAIQWLITNTYARGYSRPNPLAGFGGAITVNVR